MSSTTTITLEVGDNALRALESVARQNQMSVEQYIVDTALHQALQQLLQQRTAKQQVQTPAYPAYTAHVRHLGRGKSLAGALAALGLQRQGITVSGEGESSSTHQIKGIHPELIAVEDQSSGSDRPAQA